MVLDRIYCTKRNEKFSIEYINNRITIVGKNVCIDFVADVRSFLQTIEHKPNQKLFSNDFHARNYILGLMKIWGL